ncbi:MAG: DUF2934 domain-containing protein [Planctomycetota bacterium]
MAKRVTKKAATSEAYEAASTPGPRVRRAASRPASTPTEEQIRARAYEIYLRRNGGCGDAHSDWLQAEAELRSELRA